MLDSEDVKIGRTLLLHKKLGGCQRGWRIRPCRNQRLNLEQLWVSTAALDNDHRKKRFSYPNSTCEKAPQDKQGEHHLEDTAGTLAQSNIHHSIWSLIQEVGASQVAQMVKNLPAMQETQVQSLGQEDPLENGLVTYSGIHAWRIPWTKEPSGL